MSGVFGVILACVGIDAVSGEERFTFGNIYLLDGLGFIGVAVGLFAVAEVLINLEDPMEQVFLKAELKLRTLFPNLQDWKVSLGPIGRSSVIGFIIGVLPGAGATIASFVTYATEKKLSKHPERFGTGAIEGVAAPEAANNAAAGGAMVPLLTLGIPGSGTTAVLLGALLIHGLRPGPLLFKSQPRVCLGRDREHVHREHHAAHPEPPDGRDVGKLAACPVQDPHAHHRHDLRRGSVCHG